MTRPPDEALKRVLFVLHSAMSDLRYIAKEGRTEQAHDLADALENIPGFLVAWEEGHLDKIKAQLEAYQAKYKGVSWIDYSKYLKAEPVPERF